MEGKLFLGLVACLVIVGQQGCFAIDEESAKELSCFVPKKTMPIDMNWMGSVKKWHYLHMSRLDLYRTILDMTKKTPEEINEAELYYDSCIHFNPTATGGFSAKAYGGKVVHEFAIRPQDPGMERAEFGGDPNDSYEGTTYTTLTDNKSFIFYAVCTNGNQMHWLVVSPEKTLPKATVKKIHDHALSLGFKKEQFTSLRLDGCDKKKSKEEL